MIPAAIKRPSICRLRPTMKQPNKLAPNPAKSSGVGLLVFMPVVIFFKPIAEYFIDLYNTLAGYVHSLGALFGL